MKDVLLYDTTLRDGCQAEDISFTLEDKLRIAEKLEELGIDYIEGGYPGSNPRDADFFKRVKKLKLKNAKIASFGTTRKPGAKPSQDINLKLLLEADTPVVTLVGKTWDLHVRDDLRISQKANLEIIADSIAFMKRRVDEVMFDAEHFFDGFRANPDYALECLEAAQEGGADWIVLCDTNGGRLPGDIREALTHVNRVIKTPLGIHCHNDGELAVANTMAGVEMGVSQVQGTINGFGERCGNLNLISMIANLQLKMGKNCIKPAQLKKLREVSHFFYELANIQPNKRQAYVGDSAFAHKGGLHVSGVLEEPRDLRAYRSRVGRQSPAGVGLRPLRPEQCRLQRERVRHRSQRTWRGGPENSAPHQGAGRPGLRVPSGGSVIRIADSGGAGQEKEELSAGRISRHR